MLTFNTKPLPDTPVIEMFKEDNLSFYGKGHEFFIFYSIAHFFPVYLKSRRK